MTSLQRAQKVNPGLDLISQFDAAFMLDVNQTGLAKAFNKGLKFIYYGRNRYTTEAWVLEWLGRKFDTPITLNKETWRKK